MLTHIPITTLWPNGKAERLCMRGHRVEPHGGHNIFALDILVNLMLPHGGLELVHLMPNQRPVNRLVTACIATSSSVHPVSGMPACIYTSTCNLVIGLYTFHVTLSIPYRFHVSPCQWCHVAPLFANFACWPYRTKHDNFLIRSPFEVKRMPLKSSRWALRSGVGFAEIQGLQKFCLLGSSWINKYLGFY